MFNSLLGWMLKKAGIDINELRELLNYIEITEDEDGEKKINFKANTSFEADLDLHANLVGWAQEDNENKSVTIADNATGQEEA